MAKITNSYAWHLLSTYKVVVLGSAPEPYLKVKKIIDMTERVVKGTINRMACDEISYIDNKIIIYEKGYSIKREDITSAYLENDRLYVIHSKWTFAVKIIDEIV